MIRRRVGRGDLAEPLQFLDIDRSQVALRHKTFDHADQPTSNEKFRGERYMTFIRMVTGIDDRGRYHPFRVEASLDQHTPGFGFRDGGAEILLASECGHLATDDRAGTDATLLHRHLSELRWKDAPMPVEVVGEDGISALGGNGQVCRNGDSTSRHSS